MSTDDGTIGLVEYFEEVAGDARDDLSKKVLPPSVDVDAAVEKGVLRETNPMRYALTEEVLEGRDGPVEDAETDENPAKEAGPSESEATNPRVDATETDAHDVEDGDDAVGVEDLSEWGEVDFTDPEPDVWAREWLSRRFWMGRQGKMPYAPWASRDHPDVEEDGNARYKWSITDNWARKDTVDEWVEKDTRTDGYVVLLEKETDPYTENPDPFAFVDGDDVRCPETGEVHPGFVDLLDRLGMTYGDVSTSGSGVHALYEGALPEDVKQAVFEIDTEPWGENDEPPTVEIYDGKHVCVVTGDHVPGTPEHVHEWNRDALECILDEHLDEADRVTPTEGTDTDTEDPLDGYEPEVTDATETTDELDDVFYAVENLAPRDLPLRTKRVGEDATGWEKWDPSTYRHSSGEDSLHSPPGESVFYDQKTGRSFGLLSLYAVEQDILTKPWETLDGSDWWDAVEAAREDGAPIPEYEPGDAEHEAVLPEVENHAVETEGFVDNRDGILTEGRERAEEKVVEAITSDDRVVLEAIPTLGKSRGAVKAAGETDEQVALLTSRHELYDQVEEWGEEFGASVQRLPTFFEECPTASGAHGSEWKERVKSLYNAGATGRDIHAYAEPPCQHEGTCPHSRAWDKVDEKNADILVGNYLHAHVPKVRKGRTLIFDEFPEDTFTETLAGEKFKKAVTAYVETVDALPFDDYTEIIERRDEEVVQETVTEYFERSETVLCDTERAVHDEDFHAYAPAVVFGLVTSEDFGNGFEYAEIDTEGVAFVSYNRTAGVVHVHAPPKIGNYTQGVVALDGTPTPRMWETALGTRMNHTQVLTDDERREYLKDGLNLSVVQTTEYVKPYSSGENVNVAKDEALLDAVARKHDRDVDLITTMSARHAYPGEETAVEFDGVGEVEHFGNLKGSNQFKTSRLGAVVGSRHYGDGFIKKWAAFMGERAERGEEKGTELSYGETGDKIHAHMTEHEVAQALLRFGRDGNGAVVYVATSKIPDWVPLEATVEDTDAKDVVRRTRSEAERQVMRKITDEGRQTTAELSEVVDVSRRQVRNITEKLGEEGLVARESIGNGYEFTPTDDAVDAAELGDVDLEELEVSPVDPSEGRSEETRSIVHTWNFRPVESLRRSSSRGGGGGAVEEVEAGPNGGGRPPDDT